MIASTTLGLLASGSGEGGFNPLDTGTYGSLFWTWIIFLLAIFPMWKVVYGPILRALKERDLKASEAMRTAESAKEAAVSAQEQVQAELSRARGEAATLLQEARQRAESLAQERETQAHEEAKRMIEQARQAIDQEKTKALSEIRSEVVELSMGIAEKALQGKFNDDNQRREIAQFIEQEWRGN